MGLQGNNESAHRGGSSGPDIPADIRPKTSVSPPNPGKKTSILAWTSCADVLWHGHPAQTSMHKFRSEKFRAVLSFPILRSLVSCLRSSRRMRQYLDSPTRNCASVSMWCRHLMESHITYAGVTLPCWLAFLENPIGPPRP